MLVILLTVLAKGVFMFDDLVQRLINSLYRIGQDDNNRKINKSVSGEYKAIGLISLNGGWIYPKNIEKEMGVSSARVAKIINNLEAKNLIVREVDKNDRRRTIVTLTEKGKKFESLKKERMDFAIITMFELLGEEDSKDFVRIVEKIETSMPLIRKIYEEKFGDLEYDKDF